MDIMAIIGVIAKGVSIAKSLIEVGQDALPAINVVKDLVTGAQAGTVTQADLDQTETKLDSLIAEFNSDLPE